MRVRTPRSPTHRHASAPPTSPAASTTSSSPRDTGVRTPCSHPHTTQPHAATARTQQQPEPPIIHARVVRDDLEIAPQQRPDQHRRDPAQPKPADRKRRPRGGLRDSTSYHAVGRSAALMVDLDRRPGGRDRAMGIRNGRARHVVKPRAMEEVDRVGVASPCSPQIPSLRSGLALRPTQAASRTSQPTPGSSIVSNGLRSMILRSM